MLSFQRNRSKIYKYGFFRRKSDSRIIQRFICYRCMRTFSNATFEPAYQQNKRRVNTILAKLLCSTVSMRRAAKILNITKKTVSRKLIFLAHISRLDQMKYLKDKAVETDIQIDELQTIEHTKCKSKYCT